METMDPIRCNYSGVPESQHEGSAGGTPTDATETVALPVKLNSYHTFSVAMRADCQAFALRKRSQTGLL